MSDIPKLGRDLTLEVSVLKYEVVENAGDASGLAAGIEALKVEYLLQVRMNNSSPWTMRRRFQQISLMHESLKRRLPCLPELPAKSVVRQFSPEYLESRKNALAAYLTALSQRRDVLNTAEAQEFFGMSERDPNLRMRSCHDVFHAAEVQECNFGINCFVYDTARGFLLLGASDCNWVSRIDTKITNIKLPWEPSAPNLPTSQMTLWKESTPGSFQLQFCCRFGPSISSVALTVDEDGLCLCGLSDGSVGFQKVSAPLGVSRGATLPLIKHTAGVSALAVDQQDQWLFTASKDNSLKVYDLSKQFMLCETSAPTPARAMLLDQAQHRLFTGLQSGVIMVWDTSTLPLKPLCSIPDVTQALTRVHDLDYDSSSSTLFSASKDALRIWSVKSATVSSWGRSIGCIPVINECTAVVWAASSRELVCGFATGSCVAFVLDGVAGATYAWQAHEEEVTHMHWDDAKRRLFTSSKDKKLRVWHFPAVGRDFNPVASAVISSAPHLTAPRSAASMVENRRPRTGSGTGATRQVATGYPDVSAAQPSKGPNVCADDSDDDLTGWDR